jgi:hypothetical protein
MALKRREWFPGAAIAVALLGIAAACGGGSGSAEVVRTVVRTVTAAPASPAISRADVQAQVRTGFANELGVEPGQLKLACAGSGAAWICTATDTTAPADANTSVLRVACPNDVCTWRDATTPASAPIWRDCGEFKDAYGDVLTLSVIGFDCQKIINSGLMPPQGLPSNERGYYCRGVGFRACFDGRTFTTSRHAWDIDNIKSVSGPNPVSAPGLISCGTWMTDNRYNQLVPLRIRGRTFRLETNGVPCAAADEYLKNLANGEAPPPGFRCNATALLCKSSAGRFDAFPER